MIFTTCWGFYGEDQCRAEAKEVIDHLTRTDDTTLDSIPLELNIKI